MITLVITRITLKYCGEGREREGGREGGREGVHFKIFFFIGDFDSIQVTREEDITDFVPENLSMLLHYKSLY